MWIVVHALICWACTVQGGRLLLPPQHTSLLTHASTSAELSWQHPRRRWLTQSHFPRNLRSCPKASVTLCILLRPVPGFQHTRPVFRGSSRKGASRVWAHTSQTDNAGNDVSLDTDMARGDEEASEQERMMTLEHVIEELADDLPKVLRKELRWKNVADNLKIVDQTGAAVQGKTPIKFMIKLVRRALRKSQQESDTGDTIQVYFLDKDSDQIDDDLDNITRVVRWKITLGQEERPFWQALRKDEAVVLEVQTVFHFDKNMKVDTMRILGWLVNERYLPIQIKLWPSVKESKGLRSALEKIKKWYEGNGRLSPVVDAKESLLSAVPTRRELLTGIAIQFGVLLVGKGEIERVALGKSKDAIASLEDSIPNLLTQEPDWDYFADDFTLVDQLGVSLRGLGPNRQLLRFVRNLRDGLFMTPLRAEFDAEIEKPIVEFPDGTRQKVLIAHWTLRIDLRARIPYDFMTTVESQALAKLKFSSFPVLFSGESCCQFNEEGKVKLLKIDSWAINGRLVRLPLTEFPFRQFLFGGAVDIGKKLEKADQQKRSPGTEVGQQLAETVLEAIENKLDVEESKKLGIEESVSTMNAASAASVSIVE